MPPAIDLRDKGIENAKHQFVELYGSSLALNSYLKIALLAALAVCAALVVLNVQTHAQYRDVKPLVIRIDDVGRAEAVSYDATAYKPQIPELRYFLTRFVTTHFSRLRSTVQRDYPDSLASRPRSPTRRWPETIANGCSRPSSQQQRLTKLISR